jgi:outer membrane biosynthesis protein TonB
MAVVTTVSIGTGRKVSANYQSQEAALTVTFELDHAEQADMDGFLRGKAADVKRWHTEMVDQLGAEAAPIEKKPAEKKSATTKPAPEPTATKSTAERSPAAKTDPEPAADPEPAPKPAATKPEPAEPPAQKAKEDPSLRAIARSNFQDHAKRLAKVTEDTKEANALLDCMSPSGVRNLIARYMPEMAEVAFSEFGVTDWNKATTAMRIEVENYDPFADE